MCLLPVGTEDKGWPGLCGDPQVDRADVGQVLGGDEEALLLHPQQLHGAHPTLLQDAQGKQGRVCQQQVSLAFTNAVIFSRN